MRYEASGFLERPLKEIGNFQDKIMFYWGYPIFGTNLIEQNNLFLKLFTK